MGHNEGFGSLLMMTEDICQSRLFYPYILNCCLMLGMRLGPVDLAPYSVVDEKRNK